VRLFVGVELDERVKEAAAQIADSLRLDLGQRLDARWVPPANLHITLWFLGEVEQSRVEATVQAIDAPFHEPAFDLEISGLGAFPPSGSPRVLWLGVTSGGTPLARLHAELNQRLEPIGFVPERRAYSAHLTIARVKEMSRGVSYREVREILRSRTANAGRCRAGAVTVFRSRVSSKGAAYEALLRVPLK
jgi:2'-5' RNA ligase